MSVVDSFGDPERTPKATRLAHAVLPVMVAVTPVVVLTGVHVLPHWVGVPFLLLAILAMVTARLHWGLGRLCIKCMKDVPADAGNQSERKRRVLRFHHTSMERWFSWAWVALFMFGPVAAMLLAGDTGLGASNIALWSLLVVDMYALVTHHRLQPWCPYCRRWDDGGDHEPSPDPETSGTKVG